MTRTLVLALAYLLVALPVVAQEQMKRVGVIHRGGPYHAYVEGLHEGLRAAGLGGRHVALIVRDAESESAVEEAARALERNGVDLIVGFGSSVARAVKQSTAVVPIVFAVGNDPVAFGLVDSVRRPGGRFTGVHIVAVELTAKRLEILRELIPTLRRVIAFNDPGNPTAQSSMELARETASRLGIEMLVRHVASPEQVRQHLAALRPTEADAYIFLADAVVIGEAGSIIERANALGMATMATYIEVVRSGALAAYGVSLREQGRHVASYVSRILAGAHPGDLPVEEVNTPALAINQRTAKALGINVPEALLARADEVIE